MIAQGHGLVGNSIRRKRPGMLTDVVLTDDQRARIEANTGLAGIAAKRASERWAVDLQDAYASALYGLIMAVVGFDESHGAAFSTYAISCCLNRIYRELVQRPPVMTDTTSKGRTRHARRVFSIDEEIDTGGGNGGGKRVTRGSMIPDNRERTPAEQLEHDEAMRQARAYLEELTDHDERLHTVVRIRTDGGTLRDTGRAIGVSKERARQLETRSIGQSIGSIRRTPAPEALAS